MEYLEIKNITVGYKRGEPVLRDFSLTANKGEFLSLLGPSGCGKTTTLRTVMGFLHPQSGKVIVNKKDYTNRPPHKRNFGLVYQSYALFPHLTVFENVAFGLKMRRIPAKEIRQRVVNALSLVGLEGLENRLPNQLSGGQRQRVALARALVIEPDLLLLDEPLSNLDAKLRAGMRAELRRLQKTLGITTIYVTHDQVEALSLSDRVVVMNRGKIEQIGTPEEVYSQPATTFVARFMGFDNHFRTTVLSVHGRELGLQAGGLHLLACSESDEPIRPGDVVEVFFRPEAVTLRREGAGPNLIPGEIQFYNFQGSSVEYMIRTALGEFSVVVPEEDASYKSGMVFLAIAPEDLVVRLPGDE